MVAIPLVHTQARSADSVLITTARFLGNLVIATVSVVLMGKNATH
ncbi:MAG TPA: hypothetical protein VM677_19620 [Actinokineospora sp.]|jgi:hypothetical protein|nr:hypothetical protein [Actinokineospora sp.]